MSETKITIGICVKNSEMSIADTIKSVLNQDYSHEFMELIIVDGYSKDKTVSVIKDILKHYKIAYKIFYERKGLGYARQIIVLNAKGKYIVWVDGDMVLSREYIKKLEEFMDENPKVGITKGEYDLTPAVNWIATLEIYSRVAKNIRNFDHAIQKTSMGTSGSIYRVDAIRQVGGFDERIRGHGEDWDAELKVRKAGWSLSIIRETYRDYERYGFSWKILWKRYFKRGYDMHNFLHINIGMIDLYKMLPSSALLAGLLNSLKIYQITRRKMAFLLPIQYMFKAFAWNYGFIISHLNSRY